MIKQIPPQTYMRFAEIQYKFPGFKGQLRSIRDYPVDAGGNLLDIEGDAVDRDFLGYDDVAHIGLLATNDYCRLLLCVEGIGDVVDHRLVFLELDVDGTGRETHGQGSNED